MSTLVHYPSSIIRYIVRVFNQVNGTSILSVQNETRLNIRHRVDLLKKPELLVTLYSQLKKAMETIGEKYLPPHKRWSPFHVDMEADSEHLIIKIDGIHLVPPRKIINLLDLVLWYSFTARYGIRPKDDDVGKQVTKKWKNAVQIMLSKFEKAKRRYEFVSESMKCSTCSRPTKTLVRMQIHLGNEIVEHQVPVCGKHKHTAM